MKKIIICICCVLSSFSLAQGSLNMDLVGNLAYPQGTNDIWGYSDGSNEYALVGTQTGFSVVDVTNPSEPNELFFIPGSNSTWRDIKTWQKYAYVTTEATDGLLIVDLSDQTGQTYVYTEEFFTKSHNIYIDENGYAYIFGADDESSNGGAVILDLNNDPMNPTLAGEFDDYYLHDGMVRGDTLWGSAIYAGVFSVINVTDKSNPTIMSSYPTSCNFTHNAWISDDNNYLFTTDEQSGCNVGAYDVSDIYDIEEIDLIQDWSGTGNVIPHNTHVLGDYLITSYYTSGVTIIDASDPFNLIEVAYYDTSSGFSGGDFDGCWGAYPYLPSGLVLATDQQEGLFILHTPYGNYEGLGCTDINASNYDSSALINDGSCLFLGCMDSSAENYNPLATNDNGSCEYFCDDFQVSVPLCNSSSITVEYGEQALINCEGSTLTFFDDDYNILSTGIDTYTTDPIYENTILFVSNEEVVEEALINTGELNHESNGQNGDYSGSVYNGGLLFNCQSSFTLNSVKVYTDTPGERIIELHNNNGDVILDLLVNISESSDNGYVVELGWEIDSGNNYILTTNTQMNNDNFGDNNPLFKRTTGGLPNFPYTINNILEITEGYYNNGSDEGSGSSTDYYYYYYDWEVSFNRTCESDFEIVEVSVNDVTTIDDDLVKNKTLIKNIDFLGRETNSNGFIIKIYNDGSVEKKSILE